MPFMIESFAARYPTLYHMAEADSWPSIMRHGLLSTTALLDLFEKSGPERVALEEQHRPESVRISHPVYGSAVIRDQKPMSNGALTKALHGSGLSVYDWYRILNRKVFFWVSRDRLRKLLNGRAYRLKSQTVIEVDASSLLAVHGARVLLSPINSGSTIFNPAPRNGATFQPITQYPIEYWDRKRARDAVVELAVDYSVPNIVAFVRRVTVVTNGVEQGVLFGQ